MEWIDIGVNLTDTAFDHDRQAVLDRAWQAGISQMVLTATSLAGSQQVQDYCNDYPQQLFCTAGVHPHQARDWTDELGKDIRALAGADCVKAIGECGLDFNRVYKSGFATTQQAYEKACIALFEALDWVEGLLAKRRYLAGDQITEADWRLFTTLVRFDPVYHGHFKCNIRRIEDYPHMAGYLRELYQWPGVADTVDFEHIKQHYYYSHDTINPTRIVPLGEGLDLTLPHGRD